MDEVIPEEAKQFILQNIDSIAQMEGLLILRADPAKSWDAAGLGRALFIDEAQATQLLSTFEGRGFVAATGDEGYRYWPQSPDQAAIIDRMAELYRRYLVPITNLIHSKQKSRIQQFADAFKLRKD